jgi:hypothetical protein
LFFFHTGVPQPRKKLRLRPESRADNPRFHHWFRGTSIMAAMFSAEERSAAISLTARTFILF